MHPAKKLIPVQASVSGSCPVLAPLRPCHFYRGPVATIFATGIPAVRANIDKVICRFNYIKVMFNYNDRVALCDQIIEHLDQFFRIIKVEPGVGSSSRYSVFPVAAWQVSVSLIRWASPPESVVELCPSFI